MKEWLKKARKAFKQGNYSHAGDFYYLSGDIDNALQMYLKGGHYDSAARLCKKTGKLDQAAEFYSEAKDFLSAAECYEKIKKYKEASTMYQYAKKLYKAAEMSQKAGDFLRAAQILEKTLDLEKAGFLYIKVGSSSKAAEIFEKLYLSLKEKSLGFKKLTPDEEKKLEKYGILCADQSFHAREFAKAGYYYEQIGHYEKAAKAYHLAGDHQKQLDCLIRKKNYAEAVELIKKHPSLEIAPTTLGDLYQKIGEYEKSAQSFLEVGKKDRAAESYQLAGSFQKAAELWEELEFYIQAADAYFKAGNEEKAAEMYEKENDLGTAAELYYSIGELPKAAKLFLRNREYMKAADIYDELGEMENYIRVLQRVPEKSSLYIQACFLLGKAFAEKKFYSLAEKKLLRAIDVEDINEDNIEYYYLLGFVYEELNKVDQAREMYETVLSYDFKYKDVAQRIEGLKSRPSLISTHDIDTALLDRIRATRGSVIANRYEIRREIGQGGMGKVYLVYDKELDEHVALKLLIPYLAGDDDQVKRFTREIKISRKINHPNVIRVFDLGEWEKIKFITMEYIEGGNLQDWMNEHPEDLEGRISLTLQVCSGLDAAHKLEIIHRDIKPQNILIDKGKTAKIVDFGIARSLEITTKTIDGRITGTPEYMSPEQIKGHKPDKRSDIYSLGLVMYQLFSGRLPFDTQNIGQLLLAHLHENPSSPRKLNPKIPKWMEKVILSAMEKDTSKRYQSTEEIISDIKSNWNPSKS
jgi:tetratricopeptide (TPR) repeat protein